jgi:hypothetical protein
MIYVHFQVTILARRDFYLNGKIKGAEKLAAPLLI